MGSMVKVCPMGDMKFRWVLPGRSPTPEVVWLRVNFLRKGRLWASRSTSICSLRWSLGVGDGVSFLEHWLAHAFVPFPQSTWWPSGVGSIPTVHKGL